MSVNIPQPLQPTLPQVFRHNAVSVNAMTAKCCRSCLLLAVAVLLLAAAVRVIVCHSLVHAAHEGCSLKDALGVLVLHGEQGTGSITDLGQNHLHASAQADKQMEGHGSDTGAE
jgi:hypothetical protein